MTYVIVGAIAFCVVLLGAKPSGFSWGRSGPRIYFRFGGKRRR